jgi:hypothetical protein
MDLPATIAKMRSAGMSAEAIVQALECVVISAVIDEQAERRRAADRARKAACRQIPQTSADSAEQKGFDKEIPPTPPKEITSKNIKTTTRAKALLPSNWEPSVKTWEMGTALGLSGREIGDQLDRMRDWAVNAGPKGIKSDWDAAFRNWLKRYADERKAKNANTRKPNTIADGFDLIDRAIEDQERRLAQAEEWPGRSEDDPVSIPRLRQSAA